jgi:hypothetical protein
MTELDIGEDADTRYKSDNLRIPASAPLADVYHNLCVPLSFRCGMGLRQALVYCNVTQGTHTLKYDEAPGPKPPATAFDTPPRGPARASRPPRWGRAGSEEPIV